MFLAIALIVILSALLYKALLRINELQNLCTEIYVGVTPYVVANHRQMEKLYTQLSGAQIWRTLPYETILPFIGDEAVFECLHNRRDFDKELEEDETNVR